MTKSRLGRGGPRPRPQAGWPQHPILAQALPLTRPPPESVPRRPRPTPSHWGRTTNYSGGASQLLLPRCRGVTMPTPMMPMARPLDSGRRRRRGPSGGASGR